VRRTAVSLSGDLAVRQTPAAPPVPLPPQVPPQPVLQTGPALWPLRLSRRWPL
jgi:hypothetical protein